MTQKVTDNMVTLSGTGLVASSGGAVVQRTLTAGTGISITNGDGASGNPTITNILVAVPSGAVMHFAMSSSPSGWLTADGSLVSRTTYASLFASIGTTYGVGDGSTTFALPDLRGEFLRGWDNGRGVDTGRAIGTAQADAFKSHTHDIGFYSSPYSGSGGGGLAFSGSQQSGATGGTETRPRNIALLACIKT